MKVLWTRKITDNIRVSLEYKKEDQWIGRFYRNTPWLREEWFILIPCFPLHIEIVKDVE